MAGEWINATGGQATGTLFAISGTYVPSGTASAVRFIGSGGGGGGGGGALELASVACSGGGGGGAAAIFDVTVPASAIAGGATITIGNGGTRELLRPQPPRLGAMVVLVA